MMSRRSPLHRVIAVLSSALLLQLSLLGSGTLCPMHWGGGHGMAGGVDAHTMSHGGHHAHTAHDAASANAAAVAHSAVANPGAPAGACGAGSSCDMPWTPGACASMSGCAIGAAAHTVKLATLASAPGLLVIAARGASLPVGPTFAPELPPPRA